MLPTGDTMLRERTLIAALAGIQFCHILDFMIMMPLAPLLMREFAISAAEFGLLLSSYSYTSAGTALLLAGSLDRFDRRHLLLGLFAVFIGLTFASALVPGYLTLLLARAASGACGSLLGAQVHTIVGEVIPFARRGRASGTIMAAFSLSTVAGVPLALTLAGWHGWRASFLFIAGLCLIFWLLAARALPPLAAHRALHTGEAHLATLRAVLRDPAHGRALVLMVALVFAAFLAIPFITVHLTTNLGLAQDDLPFIYLVGGLATLFTSRAIGHLADHYGKQQVLRLVASLALVPLLLLTHLPPMPFPAVLAVTTIFFILVPGRMPPAMALATQAADPTRRGAFMAVNSAAMSLASGSAAIVAGLIAAPHGGALTHYERAGLLAALINLFAIFWVGRLRLRPSVGTA